MKSQWVDESCDVSEFSRNPATLIEQIQRAPVAVCQEGEVMFYALSPQLLRCMLDKIMDAALTAKLHKRLCVRQQAMPIELSEL